MIFTSKGKMYRLLVDNIPVGTNLSKGINIGTLINIEKDEKVIAITSLHRKTKAKYVIFITKQGLIKKTSLEEYTKVKRSTGIAAINLKNNDSLANVTFIEKEEMIVITKNGMAIHFPTDEINPIGRVTAGVKAIKLDENDEVIAGLPINKKDDCLAIVTTRGLGKKISLEELPLQQRAGKGVIIYKTTDTSGVIVGGGMVDDSDNLLIVGKPKSICISTKDIPKLSRTSIGNIMLKNSLISSIVKL